jgi:Putative binding domain, N-terminal/Viral BACON domain
MLLDERVNAVVTSEHLVNLTDRCRRSSIAVAVALLAALLVGGCSESASTVTAGPDSAAKCGLTTTAPPALGADGGNASISVSTHPECAWTASTAANWISGFAPASSQGSGTLSFRVAPNDGAAAREADIAVNDSTVRVSQRAPCRYEVTPSSIAVGAEGDSGTLTVATASDCSWNASPDVSWIAITPPASGSGSGMVRFSIAANGGAERTGTIAIGNQRSIVRQLSAGSPCSYSISPASQNVGAAGGAGSPVAVSTPAGCQWTASSAASWITITSGATGNGNGSVAFSVAANSGASRTGSLTIAGRPFTVTQAAAPPPPPCSYSIDPNSQKIDGNGGTATVAVTTGSACTWTASSNASWLTVTAGASGTGNGTVTISVARNDGKDRKGTLTIAGKTATIEQKER